MTVCAWCRAVIDPVEPVGIVSHGACLACKARLDAEIRELEERLRSDELAANALAGRCVHGTDPGAECLGCMAET